MKLAPADVADILADCEAALTYQARFIADPDKDAIEPTTLIEAMTPKHAATLRLIKWMSLDPESNEMKQVHHGGEWRILLFATTARSIVAILDDRGFGDAARTIEGLLQRTDDVALGLTRH